jgi:hypothetical protein
MTLSIKRTDAEINKVMDDCAGSIDEGIRRYPGMTYEEGVYEALKWITGQTEDNPYEDE